MHNKTRKILIVVMSVLMCLIIGCEKHSEEKEYTKVGDYTFSCSKIARQPVIEYVGGYDKEKQMFWDGIQNVSDGYAYMHTKDKKYSFFMAFNYGRPETTYKADEIGELKITVLEDQSGKKYYIDAFHDSKDWTQLAKQSQYYEKMPKK